MIKRFATLFLCMFLYGCDENAKIPLGSYGFIEEGTKFEISIGENIKIVDSKLTSRGLVIYERKELPYNVTNYNPQECHGFIYPENVLVSIYEDVDRGFVCVASIDEKVVRLSWHFGRTGP